MSAPQFDAFIAIDWSGAKGSSYGGIAVARCSTGNGAPEIVPPPSGRRWKRSQIADWLQDEIEQDQHLLIGFDFAFGFPFEPDVGYLGGLIPDIDDIFDLWAFIEARSCGEPDFGCQTFVADRDIAPLFWTDGPKPPHWIERKRDAELACADYTSTRPDTLYKLLHSKQVGKASITGMRVVNEVRRRVAARAAVWPFETPNSSVMVEIYPTIFRKWAMKTVGKLKTKSALNVALSSFDSQYLGPDTPELLSDHETDALISAVGLRAIARQSETWTPQSVALPRTRREGWIFGVTNAARPL